MPATQKRDIKTRTRGFLLGLGTCDGAEQARASRTAVVRSDFFMVSDIYKPFSANEAITREDYDQMKGSYRHFTNDQYLLRQCLDGQLPSLARRP